ncbi:hypothetical protein Lser_V15G25713 [Lactuca serriola]
MSVPLTTYNAPTTKDVDEWKKVDVKVKMWVFSTVFHSLLQMVLKEYSYARNVYLHMEKLFRDNNKARLMQLDTELRNISIDDISMAVYCYKIQHISNLLENLDASSKVQDKHLVIYVINGLSTKYEHLATLILHRSPFPNFSEFSES